MHADYLVSANRYLTNIYLDAYRLRGLYEGTIIEEGYPRIDLLKKNSKRDAIGLLRENGVEVDPSKEAILYAPSWRGETYSSPVANIKEYLDFKALLESKIDTDRYQILIKPHQRVFQVAKKDMCDSFFIPATIDANEVLSVADILITDVSSIYFDFAAANKPMIFYIQDLEQYSESRGTYFSTDDLPGPFTSSSTEVAQYINEIDSIKATYAKKISDLNKWAGNNNEDIAARVVDVVFRGDTSNAKLVHSDNNKKKILINQGELFSNGVKTALVDLLDNIDYEKYDVTVYVSKAKSAQLKKILNYEANKKARIVFTPTMLEMTLLERIRDGIEGKLGRINFHRSVLGRQMKRLYSNVHFDHVIEFQGYSLYFAKQVLNVNADVYSIFLHNDMHDEALLKFSYLFNVFESYRYFDNIVSCGETIGQLNSEKLASYAAKSKFTFIDNFINEKRIIEKAKEDRLCEFNGLTYFEMNVNHNEPCITHRLVPYVGRQNELGETSHRFVTVARLSPEKNHLALIEAFSKLHDEVPNCFLYLLGDGKLKKQVIAMIEAHGLTDNVIVTSSVDNPFVVMKNCDCFVLPSLHEGLPMSIMEARVLRMPIILSDFGSVDGSCIENGQLVCGKTSDEIYYALRKFINGDVPTDYEFDAEQHNERSVMRLEKLLGD